MAMIGRAARDSRTIKAAKASGGQQGEPDGGKFANAVERQQHRHQAQNQRDAAHDVKAIAGPARRRYRQAAQQQQRRDRDGNPEPEHRRPIPDRRQRAAEQRTQHQSERHHHRVDAERPAAPFLAIERRHQRRAAAQHQCRADALQAAENQHRTVAGRTADEQQRRRAPDQADPENDRVTDGVADAPERQQQAGVGQHVADDHPLDVGDGEIEPPGDGGEGNIDRRIELRRGRAQPDHGDLPAFRAKQAGRCVGGR